MRFFPTKIYLTIIFLLIFFTKSNLIIAQQQNEYASKSLVNVMPNRLFGLTIDESSLDEVALKMKTPQIIENIIQELRKIKSADPTNNTLTVRIVLPVGCEDGNNCDSAEIKLTNKLDKKYVTLMQRIKNENLAVIMGELIDSDIESSTKCFQIIDEAKSVALYTERTKKMYEKLGLYVDIWEIGNEVNGDWFGGKVIGIEKNNKRRKIVVAQLKAAYDFLNSKKAEIENLNIKNNTKNKIPLTAITFYFNGDGNKRNCYENINDAMLNWIKGTGNAFIDKNNSKISFANIDYVLISYYPEDNFYEPNGDVSDYSLPIYLNAKEWVNIFDTVKKYYSSNTKFGIGEMGAQCYYSKKASNCKQNDCKMIRIDLLKDGRNPCDKYDTKGQLLETRKCPCCLCAQVNVMQEYYTNLDKQISAGMQNNTNFVGGYFNWYYSADVINKANGNTADKLQAEKVRSAIIEAYKGYSE